MVNEIVTKDEFLNHLRAYADTPDDDVIRWKEKIRKALLKCPELLYALNNEELETELFDEDGNLNAEIDEETGELVLLGEVDRYFGATSNIRDYLFLPETQTVAMNYLCYTIGFQEIPRYNKIEYIAQITFTALCSPQPSQSHDDLVGIARHDLIGSIIRERFNWSNVFGTQCKLVNSRETITDTNFITRTLVFELTMPNGIVKTENGSTRIINYQVNR